MLLSLLSRASKASASQPTHRALYSGDLYVGGYLDPAYYLVPVFATIVMLVVAGTWTAFFGHTNKRVSGFLGTFVTAVIVSTYALHYSLIGAMVAFGLALIVAFVPALGMCRTFMMGAGFGATVVDIVASAFTSIFDVYPSYEVHWVILAIVIVVSAGFGRYALNDTNKFAIAATSCTGAFSIANAIVATIEVVFELQRPVLYLVISVGVGAALTTGGMVYQKAALAKATASLPIATPVSDKDMA